RILGQFQHPTRARSVRRQWLLHENIDSFLNRIFKMHGPKCQRRRKNRDISGFQAIHRLLVSVEPDKSAVLWRIDFFPMLLLQSVIAAVELVLEYVCHRHQLDWSARGTQGIVRCASSAAPATDERDLN